MNGERWGKSSGIIFSIDIPVYLCYCENVEKNVSPENSVNVGTIFKFAGNDAKIIKGKLLEIQTSACDSIWTVEILETRETIEIFPSQYKIFPILKKVKMSYLFII